MLYLQLSASMTSLNEAPRRRLSVASKIRRSRLFRWHGAIRDNLPDEIFSWTGKVEDADGADCANGGSDADGYGDAIAYVSILLEG